MRNTKISVLHEGFESQYFTATVVHAGALRADDGPYIARAQRKIPISIYVGTNDQLFPLTVVRATRDALNSNGFNSELTEIKVTRTRITIERKRAIAVRGVVETARAERRTEVSAASIRQVPVITHTRGIVLLFRIGFAQKVPTY